MSVLPAEHSEAQRAVARARVRAAEADLMPLYRLMPDHRVWSGPAGWAFGLRIEGLRARIEAAGAALSAAERAL